MIARDELARRLRLVVITDAECGPDRSVLDVAAAALRAGAPALQLRAKAETARETAELGVRLRALSREAGALLFVNDRVDIALAVEADGAHLGDDDLPLRDARAIVPSHFLLGRSVETPEQAEAAERDGADYLGVGPVFSTGSKLDAGDPIGLEGLRAVSAASPLPVVAIGGINAERAAAVRGAGASGPAVISAVMRAPDPAAAVVALLRG